MTYTAAFDAGTTAIKGTLINEAGEIVLSRSAELTTMFCYIVGVSKCLRDIQTHAEYINDKAGFF